jgi:hypothetical protein
MSNENIYDKPFLDYACANTAAGVSLPGANRIALYPFTLPFPIKITKLNVFILAGDLSNLSNVGIYDTDGNLIASVGAQYIGGSAQALALSGGPIVLGPGTYLLAFTSAATTLVWTISNPTYSLAYYSANAGSVSSSGVFPSTISVTTGLNSGLGSPYEGYPPVLILS